MRGTVVQGVVVVVSAAFAWLGAVGVAPESPEPTVDVLGAVQVAPVSQAQSLPVADPTTSAPSTMTSTTSTTSTPSTTTSGVVAPAATPSPGPSPTTTSSPVPSGGVAPTDALLLPDVTTSVGPSTVADLGDRALDLVRFDWVSMFPDWRIEFLGGRQGLRALTYPNEQRIEIFVRESDTASSLHRVIAHELGHVVDVELNSTADRERWSRQRALGASVDWWPSASAPDFATAAGDFAEAFAVWETGVRSQSTVGPQPSAEDLALLMELSEA